MTLSNEIGVEGARISRIDMPDARTLCLTLSGNRRDVLLITERAGKPVALVAPTRPKGAPASAFAQLLRKHVDGELIESLDAPAENVLRLRTRGFSILAEIIGGELHFVLFQASGGLVHASSSKWVRAHGLKLKEKSPLAVSDLGPPVLPRPDTTQRGDADVVRRRIESHVKKLEKKVRAIEADRSRADEVSRLRADAMILMTAANARSTGAQYVEGIDHSVHPPVTRRIELDPKLNLRSQAEMLFKRARRYERGALLGMTRLAETLGELEKTRALLSNSELDESALRQRAIELRILPRLASAPSSAGRARERLPYRQFFAEKQPILVGKGAKDNDALTLKVARPHDLWLHAKGRAGAHVIVPLAKGHVCTPDVLADAATLAAHFSDFRGEKVVEVSYVERKFVRKPKGSPPGLVTLQREKVFVVRIDEARLKRLLESEEKAS